MEMKRQRPKEVVSGQLWPAVISRPQKIIPLGTFQIE